MLKKSELVIIFAIVAVYMSLSSITEKETDKADTKVSAGTSQSYRVTDLAKSYGQIFSFRKAEPQYFLRVTGAKPQLEVREWKTAARIADILGESLATNRLNEAKWYTGCGGMELQLGERIKTGAKTSAAVDLYTGPWLGMSPNTQLEFETDSQTAVKQVVDIKRGTIITQNTRKGGHLTLKTPFGAIELGENSTCLATVTDDGSTRLLVSGQATMNGALYDSRAEYTGRLSSLRANYRDHGGSYLEFFLDGTQNYVALREANGSQRAMLPLLFIKAMEIDREFGELALSHAMSSFRGGGGR